MTAHIQTPPQSELTEDSPALVAAYRRRLFAMRALQALERRLKLELSAAKKDFADQLTEATKELNHAIDADEPPAKIAALQARLKQIKDARQSHQQLESEKRGAVTALNERIKKTQEAFNECLATDPGEESAQQEFKLGDKAAVAPGLELSEGTIELVDAAVREKMRDADGKVDPAYIDLVDAIASTGLSGMRLMSARKTDVAEEAEPVDHSEEAEGTELDEGDVPF